MKIIIDAMGGDHAPLEPVRGAIQAQREFGCAVVLVGQEAAIRTALQQDGFSSLPEGIEIVPATQVVEIADDPSTAWRKKKDSSLTVGLKLLAAGGGDAFISAGSTGALLSGATLLVKRIRGIKRAAVAPIVPTAAGGAVLIDAGANSECTPKLLAQFAYMGACYAELLGKRNPRVGLLNIGAEPGKGTDLYQKTYTLLAKSGQKGGLNFVGNVEGREAVLGAADVIVADGFTGNIFLKTLEGAGAFFTTQLKQIFMKSGKTKLSALLVQGELAAFKKTMDYRETGGTALLGIQKPVIKAHGSSDAYAFRSAVRQALLFANGSISERIAQHMDELPPEGADAPPPSPADAAAAPSAPENQQ